MQLPSLPALHEEDARRRFPCVVGRRPEAGEAARAGRGGARAGLRHGQRREARLGLGAARWGAAQSAVGRGKLQAFVLPPRRALGSWPGGAAAWPDGEGQLGRVRLEVSAGWAPAGLAGVPQKRPFGHCGEERSPRRPRVSSCPPSRPAHCRSS